MADSSTISVRLVPQVQYVAPATGNTVIANTNGYTRLLIDPAGTLATLTITMPSSPQDGDRLEISSSQVLTALTISGGTIVGTLTTLAVAGFASFVFSATGSKWFRVG